MCESHLKCLEQVGAGLCSLGKEERVGGVRDLTLGSRIGVEEKARPKESVPGDSCHHPSPMSPLGLTWLRAPRASRAQGCVKVSLESTSPPRGGSFPGMLL